MAAVLHLLKAGEPALVLATVARQLADGEQVEVALLQGASAPTLPAGVAVYRVPEDVSWDGLLERIFAVAHVVTW